MDTFGGGISLFCLPQSLLLRQQELDFEICLQNLPLDPDPKVFTPWGLELEDNSGPVSAQP